MTTADPFMIRAHVPHWEASVADYQAASAATRQGRTVRTLVYGEHSDERLDLLVPEGPEGGPRPVHLFVHGGYWRAFSKDDHTFMAEAITAAGAIAAIMDYSLMPAARMEVLVDQVRRAARWLRAHAAEFGGDPAALSVSGHSAGAHLASFLVCRGAHEPTVDLAPVRGVLLVSGLYDLAPITESFVQPELRLTAEEVAFWSPCRATPVPGSAVALVVGEKETAPFHDQARAFAAHLDRAGARAHLAAVPGEDHMTIVRELGRPGTACARHLAATIRGEVVCENDRLRFASLSSRAERSEDLGSI
ncbi:MAG TPA: alpha/beta hydrolase [Lichenihabitans sp.]|nr:alpha/beta hydrolase [Lichenihabitans sp.]